VRYARHKVLSDALGDPYYDSRKNELEKLAFIGRLGRPNAPDIPLAVLEKYLTSTPKGPQKFAISFIDQSVQATTRLVVADRLIAPFELSKQSKLIIG
jgi:hypothetical protein